MNADQNSIRMDKIGWMATKERVDKCVERKKDLHLKCYAAMERGKKLRECVVNGWSIGNECIDIYSIISNLNLTKKALSTEANVHQEVNGGKHRY